MCTRGENCTYAHNQSELEALPNLYKTKMCFEMLKNKQCMNPLCAYAHTKTELRTIAYKNAELEDKRHRQDFGQANYYEAKPSYWHSPLNVLNPPWSQDSDAVQQFGIQHLEVDDFPRVQEVPKVTTTPMIMQDVIAPLKEDSDNRRVSRTSTTITELTTLDKTDSTYYDSERPDEFDSESEDSKRQRTASAIDSESEEVMGEALSMPVMTWTVKNTFLELDPAEKVAGQPSRMFRSSSSPVI